MSSKYSYSILFFPFDLCEITYAELLHRQLSVLISIEHTHHWLSERGRRRLPLRYHLVTAVGGKLKGYLIVIL